MFRRFGLFIGLNHRSTSTKRLLNAKLGSFKPAMLETVQEIAIYIHRWYQIKITMRWEDSSYTSPGTPARVVQYEAPDLGSNNIVGVWRIDDRDNSFSTQPFRIKYARQDVLLSVMISFNMSLGKYEGPSTSAVILKFELMYAPILESGSELQDSLDGFPAAVHEFRIPPKALLGLHSYCPVHFDTFHAVLVELSMHIILLKAGTYTPSPKVSSDYCTIEDVAGENCGGSNHGIGQGASLDSKQITLIKALFTARDILLEELQKLSKVIDQTIDFTDLPSKLDEEKFSLFLQANLRAADAEVSEVRIGAGQVAGKPQNGIEKSNGIVDFRSDGSPQSLSKDDLLNTFHSIGNQLLYLWNTFLNFHRVNKTKILEFLRDAWANDRRAEWSIWMVYSKVQMPHHYLSSGVDESSHHSLRGKVSIPRKLIEDPAQTAATRTELHRRSIAQMRINNGSIQDMHIFGDPLHVPVIIVERVVNAPLSTTSGHSYFSPLDQKDASSLFMVPDTKAVNNLSSAGPQQNGRVLKIVVFVHGFQVPFLCKVWLKFIVSVPCAVDDCFF
ncbi:hypothetical protein HHK36_030558 [Tetracentron sinense]|uniref:Uncharacterized protein n=1 Tax=Tetracentron sinense TaxID=13715 RepID=A0A835CYU3_TETSI|nr:hypothetical protein HHK36_030558 [Tetracentron sinense]